MKDLHHQVSKEPESSKKYITRTLINPFSRNSSLKMDKELKQIGFYRKTHLVDLAVVLCFIILLGFCLWASIKLGYKPPVAWDDALSVLLSIGITIIAYRQWIAARYEISIDKYFDHLDTANTRLEALDGVKKVDMHVFAELDKFEYVIYKYELGYIPPELAFRALQNFKELCKYRPDFHKSVSQIINQSAYLDKTKEIVKRVCSDNTIQQVLVKDES